MLLQAVGLLECGGVVTPRDSHDNNYHNCDDRHKKHRHSTGPSLAYFFPARPQILSMIIIIILVGLGLGLTLMLMLVVRLRAVD